MRMALRGLARCPESPWQAGFKLLLRGRHSLQADPASEKGDAIHKLVVACIYRHSGSGLRFLAMAALIMRIMKTRLTV